MSSEKMTPEQIIDFAIASGGSLIEERRQDQEMSRRALEAKIKYGTPEQAQEAQKALAAMDVPRMAENAAHAAQVSAKEEKRAPTPDEITASASAFFAKIGRAPKEVRPDYVTYETTKKLLWDAFAQIVAAEECLDINKNPQAAMEGTNLPQVMRAVCWWLMGEHMPEGWAQAHNVKRSLDPAKGLVLWGAQGTGKSTLAKAMQNVTQFWAARLGWSAYRLHWSCMDEIYPILKNEATLAPLTELGTRHRIVDEIKEEHFRLQHYGHGVPIIENLLLERHAKWKETGQRTVMTTNIPAELLVSNDLFQDKRLGGRMVQQYEFVSVVGPDKRSEKERYAFRLKFT